MATGAKAVVIEAKPAEPTAHSPQPHAIDPDKTDFLDFAFDRKTIDDVIGDIISRRPDAPFEYIVTPNVDHVVRMHRDRPDLPRVYRRAWMTLCDSRILAKVALLFGIRLPVVAGSDLTAAMFSRVIVPYDRIAILGGSEATVEALSRTYGLTDVVHYNPPMRFIDNSAERLRAIEFLVEARARFTFLAVGSPQQELVAHGVACSDAAVGLGLCVGASLEFLTSEKARAPRFMQAMSLEWLFRLLSEPRRLWRRYLLDGPRIIVIALSWRRSVRR